MYNLSVLRNHKLIRQSEKHRLIVRRALGMPLITCLALKGIVRTGVTACPMLSLRSLDNGRHGHHSVPPLPLPPPPPPPPPLPSMPRLKFKVNTESLRRHDGSRRSPMAEGRSISNGCLDETSSTSKKFLYKDESMKVTIPRKTSNQLNFHTITKIFVKDIDHS
ncbi:hypothetical protein V1478_005883 [Vespula squamosa]|uniref:Uncharacterized protein n=1 Tax=Vespula squamosa TaxID=30214 RepID=A0ABD2BA26_VESSQ